MENKCVLVAISAYYDRNWTNAINHIITSLGLDDSEVGFISFFPDPLIMLSEIFPKLLDYANRYKVIFVSGDNVVETIDKRKMINFNELRHLHNFINENNLNVECVNVYGKELSLTEYIRLCTRQPLPLDIIKKATYDIIEGIKKDLNI